MRLMKSVYRMMRWSLFWNTCQLPEIELDTLAPNADMHEPLITERLCLPPYYGPVDHSDVAPLLTLVRARNPRAVLELGTAFGATVANICAISNATVYTVNALPEQMEGHLSSFALSKDDIGCVYRDYGFGDRVVQIYGNTRNLDFLDYIPPHSVDFAIIDACHDADFVVGDFMRVLPVLYSGSMVLLHDVHPSMRSHLRDSYIACMYLRRLGYNVQYLKGTWWGVWQAEQTSSTLRIDQRALNTIDSLIFRARGLDTLQDVLHLRWISNRHLPSP